MASKVYHYRRDLISEEELVRLEKTVSEVESMRLDKAAKPEPFQAAIERLDTLLSKIGGQIYPKTFWNDNLEVLLVAAIIVIGFRTFFFQPFIIPTNSMYPTYNGMTYRVYDEEEKSPDLVQRAFNKISLASRHNSLIAENSGSVSLLLFPDPDKKDNNLTYRKVPYNKFFIIPSKRAEYIFSIGDTTQSIQVPLEFNMLSVIREFFPDANLTTSVPSEKSIVGRALMMNRTVKKGDFLMRFDINLGDALFVDRISYHFKRPKAGDPFVFRTREIKGLDDKYYIKRLSGIGGETIEIKEGALLADGKVRDEAEAFLLNAEKSGDYKGYVNTGFLSKGRKLKIPENSFVALGDNSNNSLDSRFWGLVPDKALIGKAIFIYYPFTTHWGLAK